MAERPGLRRSVELLPIHARPERRQHHGVHRREIPRAGRRAGGAGGVHSDPLDGRLRTRRIAPVVRADAPAAGHPARDRRGGGRAVDRHRHPPLAAASSPPDRTDLCRAGVRRSGARATTLVGRRARAGAAVDRVGPSGWRAGAMNPPGASASLLAHIALLAIISFGGVPGVLPDLRDFVVTANGWLSDRDFANCFAVVQAIPGPNMILMMSFIGWRVGGLPVAIASAAATFAPPCALSFATYRFWDRFRDTAWQQRVRRGLAPVTIGLVVAGGFVMAQAGDGGWTT